MNWLVYCLTLVETNVVSIERIAEYTDTESEVSVSHLKKQKKQTKKQPKYMTSITPYVIISQWDYTYPMINIPGLRDIPLLIRCLEVLKDLSSLAKMLALNFVVSYRSFR